MSAFCQSTEVDHAGAVGEEETADQVGSPEREIEVTDQPREVAMRQILDPESEECQCKVWAKRGQMGEIRAEEGVRTEEAIAAADDEFPHHDARLDSSSRLLETVANHGYRDVSNPKHHSGLHRIGKVSRA